MQTDPSEMTVPQQLALPFDPTEIKFKPSVVSGNRALAIAYVDARVVQDRLDEVLGIDGWQDEYTIKDGDNVVCKLSCKIEGEWISKMDVGGPSEQPDGGDRMKSAFSDALKRTAVKFGVGRFLYRLPAQWVDYDTSKRCFVKPPKLPADLYAPQVATPVKPAPEKPKTTVHKHAATGEEFRRGLYAYDAKLAQQGVCQPGELVQYVLAEGMESGLPENLDLWNAETIAAAREMTQRFEAVQRAKQRKTA